MPERGEASQRVGPIERVQDVQIVQAADQAATQDVAAIRDAARVDIRQIASRHADLLAEAVSLADALEGLPVDRGELSSRVAAEVGDATLRPDHVALVDGAVAEHAGEARALSRSIAALGTSASIVSGGVAVAALEDPVALAVAGPLALALAGAADPVAVRRLFARLRAKFSHG